MSSQAITENDLREILNKVLPQSANFKIENISTPSESLSGAFAKTIAYTPPTGYEVKAVFVEKTPNNNWVYCYAQHNATSNVISYSGRNTYGSAVTGAFTFKVFLQEALSS